MVRAHRNDASGAESDDTVPTTSRRSFFDRICGRPGPASAEPSSGAGAPGDDASAIGVVADFDDRTFSAALDRNVTIVDFWAPWCGPCKQLHPLFDAQAAEHSGGGLRFGRVNVDDSPSVATQFNVMSIPTIIVFDAEGNEIEREIGLPSKRRLEQLVRSATSRAGKTTGQGAA